MGGLIGEIFEECGILAGYWFGCRLGCMDLIHDEWVVGLALADLFMFCRKIFRTAQGAEGQGLSWSGKELLREVDMKLSSC